MREILFRGKCTENKEVARGKMVYGDLIHRRIWNTSQAIIRCVDAGFDVYTDYEVDPETVGEYAGCTDVNETKIFEGDICRFTVFDWNDSDTQYKGVVVYDGSRFMLWKSPKSENYGDNGGFDLDWVRMQDDEFEVIGNIYSNPELLEGGDSND